MVDDEAAAAEAVELQVGAGALGALGLLVGTQHWLFAERAR